MPLQQFWKVLVADVLILSIILGRGPRDDLVASKRTSVFDQEDSYFRASCHP